MIESLKKLCIKHKAIIKYGIFGALTTIINIVTYVVCYTYLGISNVVSNVIAWIIACSFAFITNKIWVFESKSMYPRTVIYEVVTFFGCRLATGLMDLVIMYVAVDVHAWNSSLMKCISNIIVIVANYVASRMVIFKKK